MLTALRHSILCVRCFFPTHRKTDR
jgi:hypothetical protein